MPASFLSLARTLSCCIVCLQHEVLESLLLFQLWCDIFLLLHSNSWCELLSFSVLKESWIWVLLLKETPSGTWSILWAKFCFFIQVFALVLGLSHLVSHACPYASQMIRGALHLCETNNVVVFEASYTLLIGVLWVFFIYVINWIKKILTGLFISPNAAGVQWTFQHVVSILGSLSSKNLLRALMWFL